MSFLGGFSFIIGYLDKLLRFCTPDESVQIGSRDSEGASCHCLIAVVFSNGICGYVELEVSHLALE